MTIEEFKNKFGEWLKIVLEEKGTERAYIELIKLMLEHEIIC